MPTDLRVPRTDPADGAGAPTGGGSLLAEVVRGGVVESVHAGHLVVLDAAGGRVRSVGDPDAVFLARSSLKPVQAVAMVRAGLDVPTDQLALACASHSGQAEHLAVVRATLAGAGLTVADLQNTPALPLDPTAAAAALLGDGPSAVAQNCSGKHAAMLATCVARGWDTGRYLDPDHPLQQTIAATVAELTGDGPPAHTTVDGCGAPLFSCTLAGLATAFSRIATAAPGTAEHRVAAAVRAFPHLVGGTVRPVTLLLTAVPGLVAKDGAEGVFAAALPDGAAVAVKVADGGPRPVPAVVAAALRELGAGSPALTAAGHVPVLGHGVEVGHVRPV